MRSVWRLGPPGTSRFMTLNHSKDAPFAGKKIGLVLTGGGGKGAYEIGVWRGLVAQGITDFVAISGTSIGGLNGYLVARGNLDDAQVLWRKLGHASPLKVSVLRLVLGLLERIGTAIVFASTTRVVFSLLVFLALGLHFFFTGSSSRGLIIWSPPERYFRCWV